MLCGKWTFGCCLEIEWLLCCFSDNIPAFGKFMKVDEYESVLAIFLTFGAVSLSDEMTLTFHTS